MTYSITSASDAGASSASAVDADRVASLDARLARLERVVGRGADASGLDKSIAATIVQLREQLDLCNGTTLARLERRLAGLQQSMQAAQVRGPRSGGDATRFYSVTGLTLW